ncbi:MAG: ECF transporter S component [Candidatus Krumholzibacteriota bacterium]
MNKPGNGKTKTSPVRQPVLLGLFTGTSVGVGYLLAGVPNVELMTLVIALAGAVLGPRKGFLAGALAAAIYSLGSPYGLPHPLLLLAQICGLGLAGVIGNLGSRQLAGALRQGGRMTALILAAATGFSATLVYDLFTNLAIVQAFELSAAVVLAGAIPFFLIHAGVNTAIFTVLMPVLLPRLAHLGRSPLAAGKAGASIMPVVFLLTLVGADGSPAQTPAEEATQEPDSLTAPVADSGPRLPASSRRAAEAMGWERPLWTPFAPTSLTRMAWYSPWVALSDGGLGASAMVIGEAGTSRSPMFVRDGIPVGTGHVLADDPVLVPTEGLVQQLDGMGTDRWGGTGGLVNLTTMDPDPGKAVSAYRGIKGNHESYFRAVHVLTPAAAWRAAFEFEESVDNEGYNFTEDPDDLFLNSRPDGFPGHGKVRQSRTRLFRNLDDENRLAVEYSNGRKTKDSLPVLGADQQEVWDDGIAATMTTHTGSWRWQSSLFWKNRDLEWGDRDTLAVDSERRKIETGREGLSLELDRVPDRDQEGQRPLTGLTVRFSRWSVYDSGTAAAWADGLVGDGQGRGNNALMVARTGVRAGPTRLVLGAGGQWDHHAGFGPEMELAWGSAGSAPWWSLDLTYGGRAPRSDELLTPILHVVDGRSLSLLPNQDLEREKTVRAGLFLQRRLLGIDLAIDGSVRRLTEGISWQAEAPGADRGTWANGLEMDAARVTGSLGREGRFLGWGRVRLEGTWQSFDEKKGRASYLPPARYLRLHLMWENHFFREDGILQLALFSTRQSEMADPWDVTRAYRLPQRTVHDLLVGFRLVGVNLSLAFRNLTGDRTRMTAGALSPGQELDLRLHWDFRY